jgi:hypothetical protein
MPNSSRGKVGNAMWGIGGRGIMKYNMGVNVFYNLLNVRFSTFRLINLKG